MTSVNDQVVDWNEIENGDLEPLEFLFDGCLKGSVGAIVSPGGVGKSWFGMQLCIALSAYDLLGMGLSGGQNTMYLTAEDPIDILKHRAKAILAHIPAKNRTELSRVEVRSFHGVAPHLVDGEGARNDKLIDWLKQHLSENSAELLVLDTLRKFHRGDENSSGDMTFLTQILDEIASETGCAILFLHHVNKGGSGDQTASRGSSALVDNIRFQLNLAAMTEKEEREFGLPVESRFNYIKMLGTKANYTKNKGTIWLQRSEGGVLLPWAPQTTGVSSSEEIKNEPDFNDTENLFRKRGI